jgi:hypothetical protein
LSHCQHKNVQKRPYYGKNKQIEKIHVGKQDDFSRSHLSPFDGDKIFSSSKAIALAKEPF